ncbi:MAG: SDR family NAD(P)-dependent oxidoreductase [Pseudonocardiaceae bacterium]
MAELTGRWPDVDVLINNAAVFGLTPFEQITDETWQQYWDLNVMSGVRLARHYVPGMVSRGWGRVVFVSSESGLHIPPELVHYGVTKAAVIAAARGIPQEPRPGSPRVPH